MGRIDGPSAVSRTTWELEATQRAGCHYEQSACCALTMPRCAIIMPHCSAATLLSNLSAALLEDGALLEAADVAEQAVLRDPCSGKAHFRLAQALHRPGCGRGEDAACAVACAVALSPRPLAAALATLYADVRAECEEMHCAAQSAHRGSPEGLAAEPVAAQGDSGKSVRSPQRTLRLPADASSGVVAVRGEQQLWQSMHTGSAPVIVLLPGKYTMGMGMGGPIHNRQLSSLALVGLCASAVSLAPLQSHVLWVGTEIPGCVNSLFLAGVKIVRGQTDLAAVCVVGARAGLRMVGCELASLTGGGVLLAEHAVGEMHRCTFRKLPCQAIEVRPSCISVLP